MMSVATALCIDSIPGRNYGGALCVRNCATLDVHRMHAADGSVEMHLGSTSMLTLEYASE